MKTWSVSRSQVLLDKPWLRIREEHVVLPSGAEIEQFHLIEACNWVGVLAVTPSGEVVLVDQYRHGLAGMSRELPAGVIDPEEEPLEAAQRELLEETGYACEKWELLLEISPEPSRHTNRAWFFLGTAARRIQPPQGEQSEDIEVQVVPASELPGLVRSGVIQHGAHIGAIMFAICSGHLPQ